MTLEDDKKSEAEIPLEDEHEFNKTDSSFSVNGEGDENKSLRKDPLTLFPIFKKTYELKDDGVQRICIRCLKSKPDRCHHCSICNTCILMMDHH